MPPDEDFDDVIVKPEGGGTIVHRSRHVAKCAFCEAKHRFLCDWPVPEGLCSVKLCDRHVHRYGSKDYCPEHARAVKEAR